MSPKPVTRLIDALSVRTRFGEVMEEAEKENVRFLVSRRGKPKVVILSVEDYLRNIVKQPRLLTSIQLSAEAAGKAGLTEQQIEAEVADYRKQKAEHPGKRARTA